jgi:hypothetical protein
VGWKEDLYTLGEGNGHKFRSVSKKAIAELATCTVSFLDDAMTLEEERNLLLYKVEHNLKPQLEEANTTINSQVKEIAGLKEELAEEEESFKHYMSIVKQARGSIDAAFPGNKREGIIAKAEYLIDTVNNRNAEAESYRKLYNEAITLLDAALPDNGKETLKEKVEYVLDKRIKARVFVEHIEQHLKEMNLDQVVCKICGKNIDEIYEEASCNT